MIDDLQLLSYKYMHDLFFEEQIQKLWLNPAFWLGDKRDELLLCCLYVKSSSVFVLGVLSLRVLSMAGSRTHSIMRNRDRILT